MLLSVITAVTFGFVFTNFYRLRALNGVHLPDWFVFIPAMLTVYSWHNSPVPIVSARIVCGYILDYDSSVLHSCSIEIYAVVV